MRKFLPGLLVLTILLGVLGGRAAFAEVSHTTPQALRNLGLDPDRFLLASFSPDGRKILGSEPGTTEEIAKGIAHKVFILSVRSDGQITQAKRYEIPEAIEQISFTPDGRQVVMIARSGATWLVLDLQSGQVRTFHEHVSGQPGFRAYPLIVRIEGGRLLATGYFYDEKDFGGPNALAEVDPSQTGIAAFTKTAEAGSVHNKLKDLAFYSYTAGDRGFFCNQEGKQLFRLYHWVAGNEPVQFDEAQLFTAYDGAGECAAYSARRAEGVEELILFDASTGNRKVLATSESPFLYLTLSKDGERVVVTQLAQQEDRVLYFVASPGTEMELKPVPGLPRARAGALRMTSDGKKFCLFNSEGLRIVDIP
jgi:hypothetical protein